MSVRSDLDSRILVCAAVLSSALNAQTSSAVTLVATPTPSNFGQPVTLTATVTSGATGKVTFYDGTSVLGTSTISGSQAIFTTALLPSGVHSLHAYYSGNSTFVSSNSLTLAQTVLGQASLSFKIPVLYPAGFAPQAIAIGDIARALHHRCNFHSVDSRRGIPARRIRRDAAFDWRSRRLRARDLDRTLGAKALWQRP